MNGAVIPVVLWQKNNSWPILKEEITGIAIVPNWDFYYRELVQLRIIAVSTLKSFWEKTPKYEDSRAPLLAWYRHALTADWDTPSAIKNDFANASILQDGRAVFNIGGNKYRLVVWKNYSYRVVYIRFIGTHEQYGRIDPKTI